MCTQEEVRDIHLDEFNRKDGLRDRMISDVKENLDAKIGKFARKQIFAGVGMAITLLGAWFSLYYQVQAIDRISDDHAEQLKDVATKEDVDRIYQVITRIEDKLFNQ